MGAQKDKKKEKKKRRKLEKINEAIEERGFGFGPVHREIDPLNTPQALEKMFPAPDDGAFPGIDHYILCPECLSPKTKCVCAYEGMSTFAIRMIAKISGDTGKTVQLLSDGRAHEIIQDFVRGAYPINGVPANIVTVLEDFKLKSYASQCSRNALLEALYQDLVAPFETEDED